MPESFFILSKDYLELATDEVVAIVKMYDRFAKIKIISNLIIIQSKTNWNKIMERATFVKTSGQILRKMSGFSKFTFACVNLDIMSPIELSNSNVFN